MTYSEITQGANNLGGLSTIAKLFTNPLEAWDEFKNGSTNRLNWEVAQQNLQFQRENLDYQKALQQQIFDREDTAYQRTVEDMRNAGLNPLSMNGTNGSGEAIATEPLNNNFQAQDIGTLGAISQIMGIANAIENFDIGISKASQERSNAEIAKNEAIKSTKTVDDDIWNSKLERWQKEMMSEDLWRNTIFNREYNVFNGMPEVNNYMNQIKKLSGYDVGYTEIFPTKYNGRYSYGIQGNGKAQTTDLENELAKILRESLQNAGKKLNQINNNDWKGFFNWKK